MVLKLLFCCVSRYEGTAAKGDFCGTAACAFAARAETTAAVKNEIVGRLKIACLLAFRAFLRDEILCLGGGGGKSVHNDVLIHNVMEIKVSKKLALVFIKYELKVLIKNVVFLQLIVFFFFFALFDGLFPSGKFNFSSFARF